MIASKRIMNGVKWTSVAGAITIFSGILKLSVLSRLIDKSDFGLLAIINVFLGFVSIFLDMGITSAIFHRQKISENEYSSLFWLNVFFSVFIFLLILLISRYVAVFYEQPALRELIPLTGISILFIAFGKLFKTIEEKSMNFKFVGIVEVVSALSSLGVGVIMALLGYGIYSLIFATIVQFMTSNMAFFFSGLRRRTLLFHFKKSEVKPFLRIGAFQTGSQTLNYFNRDLDILIFAKFFGPELVGGYSLAKQLVFRPAQFFNPILTRVATPALARSQKDKKSLRNNYLKLLNAIASINIPIYIGIGVFAPFLVMIFYGNDFPEIVPFVRVLSVIMICRALGNPVGSLVVATGRTDLEFRWNLFVSLIIPIVIYLGALVSLEISLLALAVTRVFLLIPAWKFLVNKLTSATLLEFVRNIFSFSILLEYFFHKKELDV